MAQASPATTKIAARPLFYAGSVAWSSALLFVVQPIMAKSLLPRFGGSAGVWIACLLFFQVVLLLGYLYSFCLTRYLSAKAQALAHAGLLTLSLAALPLKPRLDRHGRQSHNRHPVAAGLVGGLAVLRIVRDQPAAAIVARRPRAERTSHTASSRVSNAASLLALLAYPVVIEPFFSTQRQMAGWSAGYAVALVLLAVAAARNLRRTSSADRPRPVVSEIRPWRWIALAACASTLWLAIANYLGQQVAAMPFLWVIPMTVYLLSFVLCFETDGWYRPSLYRWLMPAAWIAFCSRIALEGSSGDLQWEVPVFSAALFICCMFCHGELARSKPAPQNGLAFFYLMVAAGGALGGVFVALVAPNLFPTFLELPLGVTASVFLALYFLFGYRSPRRLIRLAVVAALAFVVSTQYNGDRRVLRTRNFYGALQIRDSGEGDSAVRTLYSGRTIHGLELLSPARRRTPTTYYGVQSGAGRALESARVASRRVASSASAPVPSLPTARSGDFFRFYEINPAVIRAAAESFDFLRDSSAATDVVRGDGRLMLDREPAHSFDIVVLDAFSDDAIPVHLLTRQAFEMYFERLRAGGLLLIHLSNRYLDLSAEVEALAADLQKDVRHHPQPTRPRARHRTCRLVDRRRHT